MAEASKSLRQLAARGGKWTAFSAIAGVLLQLAQLVLLGRLLEPADFGLMAMMMVVIGFANAVADFGLGNYIVQADSLCQRTLYRLILSVLGLSVIMAGAVALSASPLAVYYKAPKLVVLLPWLSIAIVVSALSQMLFSLLQRSFEFKVIAIGDIVSAFSGLLVTVVIAKAGYGVWALVVGQLMAGSCRVLLFLPRFLERLRSLPTTACSNLSNVQGFALFQTGERVLNYAGWNIDKLILGRLIGDVGLGIYTVAYQLMIRPFAVLNPIFTRVALPLFSAVKSDDTRLCFGYLETIRVIALFSFPAYLAISIGAPGIIFFILGKKWTAAAPVLSILCVLGMFFSIGNPIGTLVLAKGKPKWAFYLNLLSLPVYGVGFFIGARFNVIGVAWAFLLAGVVVLYPVEFVLRYFLVGMSVRHYFTAMRHLFFAAGVPLLLYGLFTATQESMLSPVWSLFWGVSATLFFYIYVYFFDRPLLATVKNLIFKVK